MIKIKCLAKKVSVLKFYFATIISVRVIITSMRKGKDSDPEPDPGDPKTYGSYGSGSGSRTLLDRKYDVFLKGSRGQNNNLHIFTLVTSPCT
jgi:hypothetical protein